MDAPRRWSSQATLGVCLIVAGIVIAAVFFSLSLPSGGPLHPSATSVSPSTPADLGERIFTTGTDENGNPIPRSSYMMFGRATCADCHGGDARGRTVSYMMTRFETPDIRWSTLSQPMKEDDGSMEPAYDPSTFGRAVTEGTDSAGGTLKAPMPRWDLTPTQIDALIAYLKSK